MMTSVASVVTAVPGRTVLLGVGVACGVALGVGSVGRRPAAGVCAVGGSVLEVADDEEAATATVGVADADAGPAEVSGLSESATAGPQADTTSAVKSAPAAVGQWRSGRRIMRRDRHFRSARSQCRNARRGRHPCGPNGTILPKQTIQTWPDSRRRRPRSPYFSRLTPRAMTRTDSMRAETDSSAINILARGDSGMVSVGLNAEEFVTETYR